MLKARTAATTCCGWRPPCSDPTPARTLSAVVGGWKLSIGQPPSSGWWPPFHRAAAPIQWLTAFPFMPALYNRPRCPLALPQRAQQLEPHDSSVQQELQALSSQGFVPGSARPGDSPGGSPGAGLSAGDSSRSRSSGSGSGAGSAGSGSKRAPKVPVEQLAQKQPEPETSPPVPGPHPPAPLPGSGFAGSGSGSKGAGDREKGRGARLWARGGLGPVAEPGQVDRRHRVTVVQDGSSSGDSSGSGISRSSSGGSSRSNSGAGSPAISGSVGGQDSSPSVPQSQSGGQWAKRRRGGAAPEPALPAELAACRQLTSKAVQEHAQRRRQQLLAGRAQQAQQGQPPQEQLAAQGQHAQQPAAGGGGKGNGGGGPAAAAASAGVQFPPPRPRTAAELEAALASLAKAEPAEAAQWLKSLGYSSYSQVMGQLLGMGQPVVGSEPADCGADSGCGFMPVMNIDERQSIQPELGVSASRFGDQLVCMLPLQQARDSCSILSPPCPRRAAAKEPCV